MIARYISKKFPDYNILILSKKYFGRLLGSIFNLVFASYFIYTASMVGSIYTNLMRNYIVGFLTPFKVIVILFICIMYAASKALKVIGRISEISFYVTIILLLLPIVALRVASMSNIYPVLGSGFSSIAKGSMKSTFAYSGAEIILLIYPFLKEKNKMLMSSLISVAMVIVLYVWSVFITTYYLGPDIVSKSYWSLLLVMGSVSITIVNNFKYIFMFLWSLIAFNNMSINGYASIHILNDFTNKLDMKKICFLLYPLLVYLTFKFGNEISRRSISDFVLLFYIVFNLLYMTIIAIFIFFKEGAKV